MGEERGREGWSKVERESRRKTVFLTEKYNFLGGKNRERERERSVLCLSSSVGFKDVSGQRVLCSLLPSWDEQRDDGEENNRGD